VDSGNQSLLVTLLWTTNSSGNHITCTIPFAYSGRDHIAESEACPEEDKYHAIFLGISVFQPFSLSHRGPYQLSFSRAQVLIPQKQQHWCCLSGRPIHVEGFSLQA